MMNEKRIAFAKQAADVFYKLALIYLIPFVSSFFIATDILLLPRIFVSAWGILACFYFSLYWENRAEKERNKSND